MTLDKVSRPFCVGSVDLRVADPSLHLELKVRAKFGASEQARYKGYAKDLDNVVAGKADALLFAADLDPYKRFTGEAKTKKPRKTLDTVLPPAAKVSHAQFIEYPGSWNDVNVIAKAARRVCSLSGEERIIVCVYLN